MHKIAGFNIENCYILDLQNCQNNLGNWGKNNPFTIKTMPDQLLVTFIDQLTLTKPIYIINNNNNFTEIIIYSGENSNITLLDHKNNKNYITRIFCQKNSKLDYYIIQDADYSNLEICQAYNSTLDLKILANPTTNNQLTVKIDLLEPKAKTELAIIQKVQQQYAHTINLEINHLAKECTSTTLSRAIASESASIMLNGRIIVHHIAEQTYANLQNKNLLLSQQASIISCPELIINNKNVICNHGSTTGHLDLATLFYLQTRGLTIAEATKLLLVAFLQPITKKIAYKEILHLNYY